MPGLELQDIQTYRHSIILCREISSDPKRGVEAELPEDSSRKTANASSTAAA